MPITARRLQRGDRHQCRLQQEDFKEEIGINADYSKKTSERGSASKVEVRATWLHALIRVGQQTMQRPQSDTKVVGSGW
jgi:hypothetical protein